MEMKTPKGTVLPLMNLKGKPYLQVPHRVVWFREDHPFGRIETSVVHSDDKSITYKATISVPCPTNYQTRSLSESGEYLGWIKLSDADKTEHYAHFSDAREKAQTGAIGRALALCGYGTQFAELSEDDRIVDSPIPPAVKTNQFDSNIPAPLHPAKEDSRANGVDSPIAMEVMDQMYRESAKVGPGDYVCEFGKYRGKRVKDIELKELDGYIMYLQESSAAKGEQPSGKARDFILNGQKYLNSRRGQEMSGPEDAEDIEG